MQPKDIESVAKAHEAFKPLAFRVMYRKLFLAVENPKSWDRLKRLEAYPSYRDLVKVVHLVNNAWALAESTSHELEHQRLERIMMHKIIELGTVKDNPLTLNEFKSVISFILVSNFLNDVHRWSTANYV
jgi:hypothetical protein